jgi:hypothetical protein
MNLRNLRTQQVCLSDENMPCARCDGQAVCEPWCETVNGCVRYAYNAVLHPNCLSVGDHIILHSLGVQWISDRKRVRSQKTR